MTRQIPMAFDANISNPSQKHNVCTMSNQSFFIVRTLRHICFTTLYDQGHENVCF